MATGQARVQPDETYRVLVDHVTAVVDGRVSGKQVGEGQTEDRTLVVIAGERDDPFGDGSQYITEDGVLGWRTVIGQVTGGQDHIGCRFEGQQVFDHQAECLGGVDEPAKPTLVVPNVAVRYLGDQHDTRLRDERVELVAGRIE